MAASGIALVSRISIATRDPIEFVDITEQVADLVSAGNLRDGVVTVFSRHTTVAVRVQEDEPLLVQDLQRLLRDLAPPTAHYRHNDFRRRSVHMHEGERPNGHSHCLQLLLGTSESIPVAQGVLQLGTWQRIFVVELDGPRAAREVVVQLVGNTDGESWAGRTSPSNGHVRLAAHLPG